MEQKLVETLLAITRINRKLKSLSEELDNVFINLTDEKIWKNICTEDNK